MAFKVTDGWAATKFGVGRSKSIQTIVLHYDATYTVGDAYKILEKRGLCAHALIADSDDPAAGLGTGPGGLNFICVKPKDRAWHAGGSTSVWNGTGDVNEISLGVEINNFGPASAYVDRADAPKVWMPKSEKSKDFPKLGYREDTGTLVGARRDFERHSVYPSYKYWQSYSSDQIDALVDLCAKWMEKYGIPPEQIVGHEHVDPKRKQDPGPAFPWKEFNKRLFDKISDELICGNKYKRHRSRALQSHIRRLGIGIKVDGIVGPVTEAKLQQIWPFVRKNVQGEGSRPPSNALDAVFTLQQIPALRAV